MSEFDDLARDVRRELGEPTPSWLRAQRQELRRAFTSTPPSRRGAQTWLIAAAFVSAVLLGVGFAVWKPTSARSTNEEMVLSAPSGNRRLELADGSSLLLMSSARARVSRGPDSTQCFVEQGTVDFQVAPQKGRSFTVIAGAFEVHVIGTRFSVSREATGMVDVRVDHGVVRVNAPKRTTPIELQAGDRLRGDDVSLSLTHPAPATSAQPVVSAEPSPAISEVIPGSASAPKASAATARNDWQALSRDRNYGAALALAKQAGADNLLATLGPQALAELADTARLGGDSELAERAFAAVMRRFPESPQARNATFLSGRLHAANGDPATAQARFERYLALNPKGAYSIEATGRLVELYAGRGDARAKDAAKRYLERAPNGPYQRLCRSVLAAP